MGERAALRSVKPFISSAYKHFEPGTAGSVLQHVRIGLAVLRPAHVIGRDHGDVAGGEMMPKRFDFASRARSAD